MFSVWVDGVEVVDYYIQEQEKAERIAQLWRDDGYEEVIVAYYQEEGNKEMAYIKVLDDGAYCISCTVEDDGVLINLDEGSYPDGITCPSCGIVIEGCNK